MYCSAIEQISVETVPMYREAVDWLIQLVSPPSFRKLKDSVHAAMFTFLRVWMRLCQVGSFIKKRVWIV